MNSRFSPPLKETQPTNPKVTFPWLKSWSKQIRRPRMTSLGFIGLLVALGVLGLCLDGRRVSAAQTDISGPAGSGRFGAAVLALPNGNIVVTDPTYSEGGVSNIGAVYLYDGATLSVISTLKGGRLNDNVGGGGVTALANGNYVVRSPNWDNPTGPAVDAGAVTWCSATTGCTGVVSADNSLIGGTAGDGIGLVTPLANGNYVVRSPNWDNPTGPVSNVGAATWGNGTVGTRGLVTPTNSLIGGTAGDGFGSSAVTAVTPLTNGNYVVMTPAWTNPTGPAPYAGAVTWGNGTGGTVGLITPSNSLVGGSEANMVGIGGVTQLTNGNYVVASPRWGLSTAVFQPYGAVTWGNGAGGTVGLITPTNSLIGGTAGDQVGSGGVTALTNGNYVVVSPEWTNPTGPVLIVGAVTWGNGAGGTVGLVTPANSLVGGSHHVSIGVGGVTALFNGNYVVSSPFWGNPTGPFNVGAVTWGNGAGGTVGLVTPANSLVGGSYQDSVGSINGKNGSVTALANGNYVVSSPRWDNPTGPAVDAGAVTWCNGTGGTVGLVTSGNSLVGGSASDSIGFGVVTPLTNGNYVVPSPRWDNPTGPAVDAGAVTWGNGTGGTVGLVTSGNSLVGGTAGDQVSGVMPLANGNYVVRSSRWDNPAGPVVDAGAVTWGNGAGGTVGLVTPANSLVGGSAGDGVGFQVGATFANGNYGVSSLNWDNPMGPVVDASAVTLGNGTGGTVGLITSANSVLGTVPRGTGSFTFDAIRNRLVVGRAASNIVSLLGCSFCTAQQSVRTLIVRVNSLVPVTLTAQKANSLTNKLDAAIKSLDHGNYSAACTHLQDFIDLVNSYVGAGFLTPAQGQPLINAATTIRTSLGCS